MRELPGVLTDSDSRFGDSRFLCHPSEQDFALIRGSAAHALEEVQRRLVEGLKRLEEGQHGAKLSNYCLWGFGRMHGPVLEEVRNSAETFRLVFRWIGLRPGQQPQGRPANIIVVFGLFPTTQGLRK